MMNVLSGFPAENYFGVAARVSRVITVVVFLGFFPQDFLKILPLELQLEVSVT